MKKLYLTQLFFLVLIVGLLIPTISAWDFDNVLTDKPSNSKYPILTIENSFGLGGDIASFKIIENTEQCLINCYAVIEVTLYDDMEVFTEMDFIDRKNNKKFLDYNIFYEHENWEDILIPINKPYCNELTYENGSNYEKCFNNITGYETKEVMNLEWKKYNGEVMKAGTYKFKIESKGSMNKGVDWAFGMQGITPNQIRNYWAWWDNDWDYKKQITNLNGTISGLYNITYNANMNANFSDLRFIDNATELIELNYTLVKKIDGVNASIRVDNLNQSAIMMYYGNVLAVSTSSINNTYETPKSMYFFDNGTAEDYANSNEGTVNGADWSGIGHIGGSYNFVATNNDNINLGDSFDNLGALTVSMWVNLPPGGGTSSYSILMNKNAAALSLSLYVDNTELPNFNIENSVGASVNTAGTTGGLYDNEWHHLAFVYDGTDMRIYQDGVLDNTPASQTGTIRDTANNNYLGFSFRDNLWMNGYMDDVYVYEKALTPTQIRKLYEENKPIFNVGIEESQASNITFNLNSPINSYESNNATVNFNCNATYVDGITKLQLLLDGTIQESVTNSTPIENLTITKLITTSEGTHYWWCNATSESSALSSSNRSFEIDSTNPEILIIAPNGSVNYGYDNKNVTLNYTITDDNLDTC